MAQRKGRPPGLRPDGQKIRELRAELGLTADQLAERVGMHPESLKQNEKGRPIAAVKAGRIARVLGVEIKDITIPAGSQAA